MEKYAHDSRYAGPEARAETGLSAYRDAVAVDADSPEQRWESAAEILASGAGMVMLNGAVALRPSANCLFCEVIDPEPSSRRCEHEFEALVENARRMLESSRLGNRLPDVPRRWRVVGDQGTGVVELWPGGPVHTLPLEPCA